MSAQRTPLYDQHQKLEAKILPFAGWEMPISYDRYSGGTKAEHRLVREDCGIFDVSHMGEFFVDGPGAADFLDRACTRPMSSLKEQKARYCLLLNENGHILDDIIVYRRGPQSYMVVVNAANLEKDFDHLQTISKDFDLKFEDRSPQTALIAVQGPRAKELTQELGLGEEAHSLKYYSFFENSAGWTISRTGYTGEDGFEVFLSSREAPSFWTRCLEIGLKPIGLGARDTLRLEVGFPLYGHELTDQVYAHETLSSFAVNGDGFIGAESLKNEPRYKPLALLATNAKPMRENDKLFMNDEEIGWITSGSTSPILNKGMGLALINASAHEQAASGSAKIFLESGGKRREAHFADLPFVETERVKRRT